MLRLLSNHILAAAPSRPERQKKTVLLRSLRSLARCITTSLSLFPLVLHILIPIVQLLRHGPLRGLPSLLRIRLNPPRLLLRNSHALAELQIALSGFLVLAAFGQFVAGHHVVVLVAAPPLEHAPVVPAAGREGETGADDVGEDVEGVEVAVVGQQGLEDFGADGEEAGDEEEGEVD